MPELGLRVQRITPEAARRLGLSSAKGVLVVEVQPGSPADQVGIEPADVIREVNQRAGRPMSKISNGRRAKAGAAIGSCCLCSVAITRYSSP